MSGDILLSHDLLHVDVQSKWFIFEEDADPAMEVLRQTPLVVVRRGCMREGRIPVGVRGMSRSIRFAAWMDPRAVLRVDRPEDLLVRPMVQRTAAMESLWRLAELWRTLERPWGPTGSVGFELASGTPATTSQSDLDVVIRFADPITPQQARELLATSSNLPSAVDVQGETQLGGFSLEEFSRGQGCLMKTNQGPKILSCPWWQEAA